MRLVGVKRLTEERAVSRRAFLFDATTPAEACDQKSTSFLFR